jgi:hypothetical protein
VTGAATGAGPDADIGADDGVEGGAGVGALSCAEAAPSTRRPQKIDKAPAARPAGFILLSSTRTPGPVTIQ